MNNQQIFFGVLGVIAATPAARRLVAYVISDRSINATRYNAQHRALNRVFDISDEYTGLAVNVREHVKKNVHF